MKLITLLCLVEMIVCHMLCAPASAQVIGTNITPTVTQANGDMGGKFFGQDPDPKLTRQYFIAAEPALWDFAPQARDVICGKPLPPPIAAQRKSAKVRYVQYTDATFRTKVMQPSRLGILGPVLRGVVGEYLAVTFLNRTAQPLSMHPHGVKYDKESEGAYYQPKPGLGAAVGGSAKFTYVWHLDESSGPRADEPSSKAWLYHSHVTGDDEINMGLVGFIVVTDPKRARPDGTPNDVDREFGNLFFIFDESGLGEAEKEAAEYASLPGGGPPPKTWTQIQEMTEQGARYGINGLVFGNLKLEMNEGERTRWYLFALGSERDFHTAHWHGLRALHAGQRTDVVELLPASMKVADVVADNPGSWMLHCHVSEHMTEGMFAQVIVHPKSLERTKAISDEPFFGLPQNYQSLRITRTDVVGDNTATNGTHLTITGVVTVFDALSVFTETIAIQFGTNSVTFRPDKHGFAQTAGNSFRVKNVSEHGVVYGGLMEFELTLAGATVPDGGDSVEFALPLKIEVGSAQHSATARFVRSKRL